MFASAAILSGGPAYGATLLLIFGVGRGLPILRAALAELAPEDVDIETVPLPPNLEQQVQQIRSRIGRSATEAR